MIRARDRVRVESPTQRCHGDTAIVIASTLDTAGAVDGSFAVCLGATGKTRVLRDDELELLCHNVTCHDAAHRFLASTGAALCMLHADRCESNGDEVIDVRPDPKAIVSCVCGESLDNVKGRDWTLGEVICEYRDCLHCHSSRPYMPAPIVAGRLVALYLDADTSEVSGEWPDLLDALEAHPAAGAVLIRNGVVLARVVEGLRGARAWHVQKPVHETPVAV